MQQNRNGRPSASNDASDWSPLGRPAFRAPVLPSIIGSHSNNNRIKLKKLGSESPEEVLHTNQQHHNCDHNSDNKPNLNSTSLCNSREKKRRRRRKARQSQQLEAELEPASIDQRSHEDKCSPIARRMSLGELDARKEGTVLGDKYGVAQNAIHSIVSSGKGDYLSDEEKVLSNESSEMDLNSGEIDHDSENVSVRSGRTSKRHQRLKERNHQHTIALAAISKVAVFETPSEDLPPNLSNNPLPKIAREDSREFLSPLRRDRVPVMRSDSNRVIICTPPQPLSQQPVLQILPAVLPVLPSVRTLANPTMKTWQPTQSPVQKQPIRDELPEYREDHGPNAAVTSIKGLKPGNPNWRNQDNFFVMEKVDGIRDMGLYCVLDGHGQYGHDVARTVVESFPQHIKSSSYDIKRAFYSMQSTLCSSDLDVRSSGATCVLAVLNGSRLSVANCGDSRAVLGRKNTDGTIDAVPLTKDHKPENVEEHKRILASGGQVGSRHVLVKQPDGAEPVSLPCGPCRVWYKNKGDTLGLAMSRSLGDAIAHKFGVSAEPEVLQHTVASSDEFLILATDGVWDVLSNEEACLIVFSVMTNDVLPNDVSWPQLATDRITSECRGIWEKRSAMVDDITVIVIRLQRYR